MHVADGSVLTGEDKKTTGCDRIIMFIGDQLTVDRLWILQPMRVEDYNSFDRYDFSYSTCWTDYIL